MTNEFVQGRKSRIHSDESSLYFPFVLCGARKVGRAAMKLELNGSSQGSGFGLEFLPGLRAGKASMKFHRTLSGKEPLYHPQLCILILVSEALFH